MRFLNVLVSPFAAAAFCGCLVCVSCGNGLCGGETSYDSKCWASSEDCMNGYSIVSDSTGLMGLAASDGARTVVPPLYGELFFLTDNLLAGFEGGMWSFLDTEGRRLAQVEGGASDDAEKLLEEYWRLRAAQLDGWEGIVRGYERFCSLCSEENASLVEMKSLSDSLLQEASRMDGVMGEGQRRRIEDAFEQYRERRRI